MARFTYTAQRADGEVYTGSATARDRFELYRLVRREGGHIVSLSEDSDTRTWSFSYWSSRISTVSEYEKVLLARNLGAMLASGLALARALSVLERQTRNHKLKSVLAEVSSEVRRGQPLHEALARFPRTFSNLFIAMVRSGEESGDLSGSLLAVSEQMERMYQIKKKVRGALIYPSIIVIAIVVIAVLMMTQVVPTLAETFREMDADLPLSTQTIIAISDFLVEYTSLALILFLLVSVGAYMSLRSSTGRRLAERVLLMTPVIGMLVREVNAARTTRTLSSLLSAGVDVMGSLEIVGSVVQNSHFREVIRAAGLAVGKGEPLSSVFARREDLYPAYVGEMIAVGEETGQLTEMLKRLAVHYEDEVDRKTKDLSTIIEPFLMLLVGGAVGFFALAMITPIYEMSQNI
ncbi:hypothetical protein COU20_03015 [Candidatus Kaiserbacteria bacterium CG10_big_fil_rev_8_21_14_0_10_59_10]|uniref:Type II secretion system protein GspF domain-containing protein n=1 Tax=Candidatus Kaiserbacteria bacterium CG10_big_fil_rev_8_21_14_0_10_59_10 TaxID=1974612 RepID=A0A2H0U9E5_9BACT|nr:MAG: hypothetical protein COU20_03015 [Candidatus Kaiserbacteria bacterium CG10_big_fil_rev_8_21_14_0_10_59_10]